MNLTETPEIIRWPETHYIFIEKVGSFPVNAPAAWQEVNALASAVSAHNRITGAFSLYKMGPEIYRAGFALSAAPVELPTGLGYVKFAGGSYKRFVLTGSYSELGPATGRVWEMVAANGMEVRDDYAIENYVTDPTTTPEDQNVTEILVPTR
jgi:effector-binding domain-containing protein